MKERLLLISAVILVLLGCFAHTIGYRWGLPSEERRQMVISEKMQNDEVYRAMVNARNEIFDNSATIFTTRGISSFVQSQRKRGSVRIVPPVDENSRFFYSIIRSYLIRTFEPDIGNVLNALASMNPQEKDFFPDNFSYGLLYLFIVGFVLKGSALLGIAHLSHDLMFYLRDVSQLASIYISIRLISIAFTLLCAGLVYKVLLFRVRKKVALFCAGLFLFMPTTVIQSYVAKPHVCGAFFALMSFYFLVVYVFGEHKKRMLIASSISAGLAYGCVPINIVYVIPVMWMCVNYLRQKKRLRIRDFLTLFLEVLVPWMIIVTCFSVYVILYKDLFVKELSHQVAFYTRHVINAKQIIFINNFLGLGTLVAALGCFLDKKIRLLACAYFMVFVILLARFDFQLNTIRFFLPFVAIVLIGAAYSMCKLVKNDIVCVGCITLFSLMPVLVGALHVRSFLYDASPMNTRYVAGNWINANIEKGSIIATDKTPNIYHCPPFRFYDYVLAMDGNMSEIASSAMSDYVYYVRINDYNVPCDKEYIEHLVRFKNENFLENIPGVTLFMYPHVNPVIDIYKIRTDES